jgi:hypothetical protein
MFKDRVEPRKVMMARVEVRWEDQAGGAHNASAMLEDKSLGGACLRLGKPIAVETRLQVRNHGQEFSGIVRHCHARGLEFVVGIQCDVVTG